MRGNSSRKGDPGRRNPMELQNKVCLIAGASGAIGASVARRFFEEGARLALTYRTQRPAILNGELVDQKRIASYRLDITDWKKTNSTIQQIAETFSGVDVLVNCTGTVGPIGP